MWESGRGVKADMCLLMKTSGMWFDTSSCLVGGYFLCQGNIRVTQQEGLLTLKMSNDDLKFFPFYVIFKSQALIKQMKKLSRNEENKGIRDAGSTADIRMLWPWSALVCLGLL